jgi:hypothetical protein
MWLKVYTRHLAPGLAAERASEVEFELWEHALVADARWSPPRAATSLVLRTTAGVPRDLSWRRAARTDLSLTALPPVRLLGRRHRPRFWVPLQAGHVFDQTNGMAGPRDGDDGVFGPAGGAARFRRGF